MNEINRNENSVYCGDLFSRYPENFPLWVFLELIPFGRLVSFYGFCASRFQDKKMKNIHFKRFSYLILLTNKKKIT